MRWEQVSNASINSNVLRLLTLIRPTFIFILLWSAVSQVSFAAGADSAFVASMVFVESLDEEGKTVHLGTGVITKNGFVATNYHYTAGVDKVIITKPSDPTKYEVNGYLSVEESKDLIILSVPNLKGQAVKIGYKDEPEQGKQVRIIDTPENKTLKHAAAIVKGHKEIAEFNFPQLISTEVDECIGGPVFLGNELAGFVIAGYLDNKFYSFLMPASELRRIMNRSFIIKDLESLEDESPVKQSHYQSALIESLTAILWMPIEDAIRLAEKKNKKVLIDVFTDWNGWCKVMDQNTYSVKMVIRYINENYYAVKLDAESRDVHTFKGKEYTYDEESRNHQLAYSLLDGKMDFPSTIFLDESSNVLTKIPGYIDAPKMDVVLHYFSENAYLQPGKTFQDFEQSYINRKED